MNLTKKQIKYDWIAGTEQHKKYVGMRKDGEPAPFLLTTLIYAQRITWLCCDDDDDAESYSTNHSALLFVCCFAITWH